MMSDVINNATSDLIEERRKIVRETVKEGCEFVDLQQRVGDNAAFVGLAHAILRIYIAQHPAWGHEFDVMLRRKAQHIVDLVADAGKGDLERHAILLEVARQLLEKGMATVSRAFSISPPR